VKALFIDVAGRVPLGETRMIARSAISSLAKDFFAAENKLMTTLASRIEGNPKPA
jgi:hypothetical protein